MPPLDRTFYSNELGTCDVTFKVASSLVVVLYCRALSSVFSFIGVAISGTELASCSSDHEDGPTHGAL
jgi:hypothetical protein